MVEKIGKETNENNEEQALRKELADLAANDESLHKEIENAKAMEYQVLAKEQGDAWASQALGSEGADKTRVPEPKVPGFTARTLADVGKGAALLGKDVARISKNAGQKTKGGVKNLGEATSAGIKNINDSYSLRSPSDISMEGKEEVKEKTKEPVIGKISKTPQPNNLDDVFDIVDKMEAEKWDGSSKAKTEEKPTQKEEKTPTPEPQPVDKTESKTGDSAQIDTKPKEKPTARKPKSPNPPKTTLELGRRIGEIRKNKKRGFLLRSAEFNSEGENSPEGGATEASIKKDIKNLSPEEKKDLTKGLHNIGFIVEKNKNKYFAKTFDWLASKQTNQKGTVARFTRGLSDSYQKDAEIAERRSHIGKDARPLTKAASVAYLAKNIIRPVRLAADIFGISPGSAQRFILGGAMLSGRIAGTAKEARFANEEVLEKNRTDEDTALKEAKTIYDRATAESKNKNPSKEDLQNAYLRELPLDLQKRLENTSITVAHNFFQKILRNHLESDVDSLNLDIIKIEENKKLSEKEKKAKKEQIISLFEKRLMDYDRILSQSGEVDTYALLARYAESTSKNVARAMTVVSLGQFFWGVGNAMSSFDKDEIVQSIKKMLPKSKDSVAEINPPTAEPSIQHDSIVTPKSSVIETDTSAVPHNEKMEPFITSTETPNTDAETQAIIENLQGKPPVGDAFTTTHEQIETIGNPVKKLNPLEDVLKTPVAEAPTQHPTTEEFTWGTTVDKPSVATERPSGTNVTYGPVDNPNAFITHEMRLLMQKADMVYDRNIKIIFPNNTDEAWDFVGPTSASKIMEISPDTAQEQGLTGLLKYLHRLEEVTGLEPKSRSLTSWKPETTDDYIKRAIRWAVENKKLEEITIQRANK